MQLDDDRDDRLATEISLLESMYPDQVRYHVKGAEVGYKDSQASFTLRLPETYLQDAFPEVISASAGHVDLRETLKSKIVSQCSTGEEILDAIIMIFNDVVQDMKRMETSEVRSAMVDVNDAELAASRRATVIVYLHHLLNTNKRKQCSSPPSSVSGVTKPGYPGVLIYSGPFHAVHEHVNELKTLNWQAFQVRMDVEEEWNFTHGGGVIEVESMGEVVKELEGCVERGIDEDISKRRKMEFLEAMKMKG